MSRPSGDPPPFDTTQRERSEMRRFESKVDKSGDCWVWKAATDKNGYGTFSYKRRNRHRTHRAHRIAWMLHHGRFPPDGMLVCHTCDNPSCVNPDHLFLGTPADNMADKMQKGRGRRMFKSNEDHPNCRLTDAQVEAIKTLSARGEKQASIARSFQINQGTVSRIVNGKRRGEF